MLITGAYSWSVYHHIAWFIWCENYQTWEIPQLSRWLCCQVIFESWRWCLISTWKKFLLSSQASYPYSSWGGIDSILDLAYSNIIWCFNVLSIEFLTLKSFCNRLTMLNLRGMLLVGQICITLIFSLDWKLNKNISLEISSAMNTIIFSTL